MENNYYKTREIKNLNRWVLIAGCIVLTLFSNNVNAQCTGTPSPAGTASALPAVVCSGGTSVLSLTGYDSNTGITLQWQSSSSTMASGGTYANVSGGSGATTDAYTSGAQSSTTYYTVLLTCTNTGDTSRSNEVTVTVNPLPAAPTISTTTTPICDPGTITFTSSYAGSGNVWSPGGSTADNVVASGAGSYSYTVTYTDGNGCTSAASAPATGVIGAIASATINYPGSPYCTALGTAPVSFSGTTGGTYSALPAGLSISALNGTVNLLASTPGTYTVSYDITTPGCTPYSTTTSITVTGGPLSGTYTIDKTLPATCTNYTSFANAFSDLNTFGMSGAVTFEVASGQTDTANLTLKMCALGANVPSASQYLRFVKVGGGANPVITAGTGTGLNDAVVKLIGVDYTSFTGIDVRENANNTTGNTMAEAGYVLLKCSGTDGAQYDTIQNCTITMNKLNPNTTIGIYAPNLDETYLAVAVTAISGAHSYNKYLSNTISNCYDGIVLGGYTDLAPYAYYDTYNDIGATGLGNNITNLGGGTAVCLGIATSNQDRLNIVGNTVNTGASAGTGIIQGISLGGAENASSNVIGNTVTIKSSAGSTSQNIAIINNSGSRFGRPGSSSIVNTVKIQDNIIQNCTYTGTNDLWLMYAGRVGADSLGPYNVLITGNQLINNTSASTNAAGTMFGIISQATMDSISISNNTITGNTYTGTSAAYAFRSIITGAAGGGTGFGTVPYVVKWNVSGNVIEGNVSAATTGITQGIAVEVYTGASIQLGSTININNNKVGNTTITVASAGQYTGISNSTYANSVLTMNGNKVYNITRNAATTGALVGIQAIVSTSPFSYSLTNDTVSGISMTGATTALVTGISSTSAPVGAASTISSNLVSNITLNGTGTLTGITNTSSPITLNVSNNRVTGLTKTSTGTMTCINWATPTNSTISNNTVSNNAFSGAALAGTCTLNGIIGSTSLYVLNGNTVSGLSIGTMTGTSTCTIFGITNSGSPVVETVSNNIVRKLSISGTSTGLHTISGLNNNTTSGGSRTMFGNVIDSLYTNPISNCAIKGIASQIGGNVVIYKNKVFDLYPGQNGATVVSFAKGISHSSSGNPVTIYNNMVNVDVGTTPLLTTNNSVVGIEVSSGTAINIYNNTVRVAGTGSGTTFGSSGISITTTTPVCDIRNNIVLNYTNAGGGAGAVATALRRSAAAVTGYSALSNNNIYYGGAPSSLHLLYYDGTNSYATVATLQAGTGIAPRETNTTTEDVQFQSLAGASGNFLKVNTSIATNVEGGAQPIALPYAITTDYFGTTRNATNPDIGAHEDNFVATNMVINSASVSPGSNCTSVSHAVTAVVTPGSTNAVTGVSLSYSYNGTPGAGSPVAMTGGPSWTGTIPAATPTNAVVTWSVTATDAGGVTKTATGASYKDEYLSVTANPASISVCPDVPTQLSSTVAGGSAILLSGTSQYVEIAQSPSLDLTAPAGNNITLEAWVKPNAFVSLGGIISHYQSSSAASYFLRENTTLTSAVEAGGSAVGGTSPAGALVLGTWTHVAAVFINQSITLDSVKVYVNGVQVAQGVSNVPHTNDPLRIGSDFGGRFFNGQIDEVRVWAAALTPATLNAWKLQNVNASHPNYASLRAYYNFDELSGNTVVDLSGNGNNGTIQGGGTRTPQTLAITPSYTFAWLPAAGLSNAAIYNPIATLSAGGSTTYTVSVTDGGCTATATSSITVYSTAPAPTPTSTSQCGYGVPTSSVAGQGGLYYWYLVPTGGTALPGQTLDHLVGYYISTTTTFYVSEFDNTCEGPRAMVIATVTNPDAIQATASLPINCPFTDEVLTAVQTGNTNTYTYEWTASPAAGSGIPTTASGSPVTIQSPNALGGTYVYTVTATDAGNSCATQSTVSVTYNAPPPIDTLTQSALTVCSGSPVTLHATSNIIGQGPQTDPAGYTHGNVTNTTIDEELYQVTVNGASTPAAYANAAGCTTVAPGPGSVLGSYSNFTTLGALTTLVAGQTYSLTVSENECDGATYYFNGLGVWCDYNRNGVFDPVAELVKVEATTTQSPRIVTYSFTVPVSALPGLTRMRFIIGEGYSGATMIPTLSPGYGEIEDWAVNILSIIPNTNAVFTWNPGNLTGSTVTVNPTSQTTYTVSATVPGNVCANFGTLTVNTNPLPPTPTGVASSQCGAGIPTCSVIGNGGSFVWYTVPTGGSPLAGEVLDHLINPSNSISATTTFYVSEYDNVCESLRAMVIGNVVQPDSVGASASLLANCPFVNEVLTATQVGTTNNYTYTWTASSTNAGITGSMVGNPITVQAQAGGTFVYTVTANDPNGCAYVNTVSVTYDTPPVLDSVIAVPSTVCSGGNVNLSAYSASIGAGPQTPPTGYCATGIYTTGCTFPDIITNVHLQEGATDLINRTSLCDATTIPGYSSYSTPNPTLISGHTYTITMSTGGDVEGVSAWIDYNRSGVFDALEVILAPQYAGTNPATYTGSFTVPASASPGQTYLRARCTYSAAPAGPCTAVTFGEIEDYLVNILAIIPQDPNKTYTWQPGGMTGANVSAAPTGNTVYSVTVSETGNNCVNIGTVSVTALALPAAPQNNDGAHCGVGVPTCSVTGNGGTFHWYLTPTGGIQIPGESLDHLVTYTTSSSQYFYVSEDDGQCESDRVAVYEDVFSPDAVAAHSSTPTCINEVVHLTLTQTGGANVYSFTWTATPLLGSGLSGPTPGAVNGDLDITPTAAGTYTYTVDAYDPNTICAAQSQVTVTVGEHPLITSVTASPNPSCAGSDVTLTALTGVPAGTTYSEGFEIFPGGFAATGTGVTWTGSNTYYAVGAGSALGTYAASANSSLEMTTDVSLVGLTNPQLKFKHIASLETGWDHGRLDYSLNGGSTWIPFPASTYAGAGVLVAASNSDPTVVGQVAFQINSYPASWATTFPAAPGTAEFQQETINLSAYNSATTFRVRFRLTSDGSVNYAGWLIDDVAIAYSSTSGAGAYNWQWTPGGLPSGNVAVANPLVNTDYTITATDPASGCSSSATVAVTVLTPPGAPTASAPSTQCGIAIPTCSVTGSGGSFHWYLTPTGGTALPGEIGSSLSAYSINTTTTFYVSEDDGACESARTMVIANVTNPDALSITPSANPVCGNSSLTLTSSQTGSTNTYTYAWSASPLAGSGLSGTPTTSAITVTPTTGGSYAYTIVGTDASASCVTSASITITVTAPPTTPAPTANPVQVCPGSCSVLNAGSYVNGNGLLTTPNLAGNGSSANFFDVTNTSANPITLHYFSMQMSSGVGVAGTGTVYYLPGGMNCVTPVIGAFTVAGTAGYISAGPNPNPYTQIPMDMNITIPAGATYGICVSSSGNQYTNGTSCSTVLMTDPNFIVYQGWGGTTTGVIATRNWNGSFDYTYAVGNPNLTYAWNPGATLSDPTSMTPTACPTATTDYTVVVTDPATTCTASGTVTVTVLGGVTATPVITANPMTVCGSGNVALALTNPVTGLSYQWQSGTSATGPWTNIGSGAVTTSAFISVDTYFRIYASCGTSGDTSLNVLVTVVNPSIATTTGATRCGIGSVTMSVTGNGSFDWYANASGGTPLATNTASYTTTVSSTTTFWVQAYIGTCLDPLGRQLVTATVTNPPAVNLIVAPGTSVCAGQTVTFTASSPTNDPNYSYRWSTDGINTIAYGSVYSVIPTAATSYYLTAVDTTGGSNAGCATELITPIVVNPVPPTPVIDPTNPTVCSVGGCTTLSVQGATVSAVGPVYIGDPNTGTSSGTTTYPAPYGQFYTGDRSQILVLASEMSAMGMVAGNITELTFDVVAPPGPFTVGNLASPPLQNFTIKLGATSLTSFVAGTPPFELGLTQVYTVATYTAAAGLNTHTFNTPFFWDGVSNVIVETCYNNDNGACPVTNYGTNASHKYTVTPFVSCIDYHADGSCVVCGTANGSSTSANRPNIQFTGITGSPITYTWSTTPTPTVGPSAVVCPTATTTYTVVASLSTGCTSSASVTVVYDPITTPTMDPVTICPGGSTTLNAGAGYTNYSWSTGETTQSITVTPASTTTYTVTVDNGGVCSQTASVTVTVQPLASPVISSSNGSSFCSGGSTTLDAGSYASWLWSTSATTQSISVNSSGTYTVTVTAGNGCTATSDITITVNPNPTTAAVTPVGPIDICSDGSDSPITLTADTNGAGAGASISWNDIGGGTDNTLLVDNNSLDLLINGNTFQYGFTVTNSYGCQASSNLVTVNIVPCGSQNVVLNATLYLEGYYAASNTGLMDNYGGGGCLFLNGISLDPNDADTVEISMMDASTYALVDAQKGILKVNGTVTVTFGPAVTAGTAYYIRVKHRNAVQTWSANPVMTSVSTSYNFSTAQTQAYGNNMVLSGDGLHWTFYSGDISDAGSASVGLQDEVIESQDYSDMENAVFITLTGYEPQDITGDIVVESLDYSIMENNVFFVIQSMHP